MLGVCGGIAAYKAVEICRRLVDAGAHVAPVLTPDATRFVGALTFSALGSEPAQTSLWDGPDPIPHTRLGQSADVIVVAPATARLIGAYAAGISDDLLTATLLATRAPVVICPAMHTEMWEHPAVTDNIALLRRRGVHVVDPGVGRLAGGDEGAGRLAEPADVVAAVERILGAGASDSASAYASAGVVGGTGASSQLAGVRILVTAGGTREPIDPVRFIGNRSSGKQGHAIADEAAARGAEVSLITTTDRPGPIGAHVVRVATAAEMEHEMIAQVANADVVVMAAAVADWRPKAVADRKLKKGDGVPEIVLEPTPDILASLGVARRPGQLLIGFAAETASDADLRAKALDKLRRKHLDVIVANDVSAPGVGFGHDTNAVLILGADGNGSEVPLSDKRVVAAAVLDAVVAQLRAAGGPGGGGSTTVDPSVTSAP
ncbi:MAG TPA: bifunctional phosphopantothenoylcysteine decarboxylase/phosphopantothenate--cysteine ligase CoaBC, partial [Acidimicrobiales bacterium]|nr:bifunctional phosphopantothenoylcysteine decarboxylase/phosphopantothenate--cysteine ligase CoaBC [Acidimicrobiales bacterium]